MHPNAYMKTNKYTFTHTHARMHACTVNSLLFLYICMYTYIHANTCKQIHVHTPIGFSDEPHTSSISAHNKI